MSGLEVDIDVAKLKKLAKQFDVVGPNLHAAFKRAIKRTAATLRKKSSKGLQSELDLRSTKALRKRIKELHIKADREGYAGGLWYGLNDLPVSAFKGRPKRVLGGAEFRGVKFPGGFIRKNSAGKLTIFKRKDSGRLPIIEQTMPVKDQMEIYVEDQVFEDIEAIFYHHLIPDLKYRALIGKQK